MSETLNIMQVVELDIHPDFPVLKCLVHRQHKDYLSGYVLGVDELEVTADLEESTIDIRLNGAEEKLVAAILARQYRNRKQVVRLLWVGNDNDAFDPATPIETREFWYYADSHHFDARGNLYLTCLNTWSRFEQHTNARTNHAEQTALIARGVVGDGTPDRAFERAGVDFSNVGLGRQNEIVQKKKTGIWPARKTQRIVIPGQEATPLNDDGSQYQRDLAIGPCRPRGNLISAWNPTPENIQAVFTAFEDWPIYPEDWKAVPDGSAPETRFVVMVYAVAEGRLNDLIIWSVGHEIINPPALAHLLGGPLGRQFSSANESTWQNFATNIDVGFGIANSVIASVTARTGAKVSTPFNVGFNGAGGLTTLAADDNVWSDSHVGHGVALAAIVAKHDTAWPGGIPDIQFSTIRGMLLPDMTAQGVVVENAVTAGSDGANPANVVLALLTSKVYGYGLDPDIIDYDSFVAARDNTARWRGAAHPIRLRGLLRGDLSLRERLAQVLDAGSMLIVHNAAGRLAFRVREYPTAETRRQMERNLFTPRERSPIANHEGAATSEVYNHAAVRAPVANQTSETDDFETMIVDDTGFRQDNHQVSTVDLDYPLAAVRLDDDGHPEAGDIEHLRKLGRAEIDRSRLNQSGSFTTPLSQSRVWRLEPGDIITLEDTLRFGSRKVHARVVRMIFRPPGLVEIDWVEYDPLIYDLHRPVSQYHAYALATP